MQVESFCCKKYTFPSTGMIHTEHPVGESSTIFAGTVSFHWTDSSYSTINNSEQTVNAALFSYTHFKYHKHKILQALLLTGKSTAGLHSRPSGTILEYRNHIISGYKYHLKDDCESRKAESELFSLAFL